MTVLGLIAPPKAGKGVVVDALVSDGWTHISMSKILYEHMVVADEHPERNQYFESSSHFREQTSRSIIAEWCMEEVRKLPHDKQERVIIDGIRNVGELEYISRLQSTSVHFLGIVADENPTRDREIRRERFAGNVDQRGEGFERLAEFDAIDDREWDSGEFGSQIGECLRLVSEMKNGQVIINNGTTDEERLKFQDEIRVLINTIEGSISQPERK